MWLFTPLERYHIIPFRTGQPGTHIAHPDQSPFLLYREVTLLIFAESNMAMSPASDNVVIIEDYPDVAGKLTRSLKSSEEDGSDTPPERYMPYLTRSSERFRSSLLLSLDEEASGLRRCNEPLCSSQRAIRGMCRPCYQRYRRTCLNRNSTRRCKERHCKAQSRRDCRGFCKSCFTSVAFKHEQPTPQRFKPKRKRPRLVLDDVQSPVQSEFSAT